MSRRKSEGGERERRESERGERERRESERGEADNESEGKCAQETGNNARKKQKEAGVGSFFITSSTLGSVNEEGTTSLLQPNLSFFGGFGGGFGGLWGGFGGAGGMFFCLVPTTWTALNSQLAIGHRIGMGETPR